MRTDNYDKCNESYLQNSQQISNYRTNSQCPIYSSNRASPSNNQVNLNSSLQENNQRRYLQETVQRVYNNDVREPCYISHRSSTNLPVNGHTQLPALNQFNKNSVLDRNLDNSGSNVVNAVPSVPHFGNVAPTVDRNQFRREPNNYSSPMGNMEVPWTVV